MNPTQPAVLVQAAQHSSVLLTFFCWNMLCPLLFMFLEIVQVPAGEGDGAGEGAGVGAGGVGAGGVGAGGVGAGGVGAGGVGAGEGPEPQL